MADFCTSIRGWGEAAAIKRLHFEGVTSVMVKINMLHIIPWRFGRRPFPFVNICGGCRFHLNLPGCTRNGRYLSMTNLGILCWYNVSYRKFVSHQSQLHSRDGIEHSWKMGSTKLKMYPYHPCFVYLANKYTYEAGFQPNTENHQFE